MSLKFTDLDGPDTNGHNVYSAVMAAVDAGLPMPAAYGADEGTAFVRLRDEADRLVWARRLQFHGVVGGRWGTRWVALTVAAQPVTAAAPISAIAGEVPGELAPLAPVRPGWVWRDAADFEVHRGGNGAVRIRHKTAVAGRQGRLLGLTSAVGDGWPGGWCVTWLDQYQHGRTEFVADSVTAGALLFEKCGIDPREVAR